jgi:hypothetical protein
MKLRAQKHHRLAITIDGRDGNMASSNRSYSMAHGIQIEYWHMAYGVSDTSFASGKLEAEG